MKRTPDIELDNEFEFTGTISKAWVDTATGERHIRGVASGVEVDRDGERVSRNAIQQMAKQVKGGGIALTASHQQDWWSTIGKAVEAKHDDETGELIIDAVIPPEGEDGMADKGWRAVNTGKIGFSIGGKLLKSYFERDELGKKRKVLDSIGLKHFALTESPAYQHSFAEAVAKTFTGDAPADDEFTLDTDDEVEKDTTTGSWVGGSSESGGGNTGRDSVGSGPRNAGSKSPKSKGMDVNDDGDDEDGTDDEKLPKAPDERHLACPNCGHEFAADLPIDPEERQLDDNDNDDEESEDDDRDTGKSTEENSMSALTETLDALKALAADEDVAKTDPEPTADAVETVEVTKTDDEQLDVLKLVAASHKHTEEKFSELEATIGEALGLIAKSYKQLVDRVESIPQGRRSVARILPPDVGHDGLDGNAEKPVAKQIEDAPDALSALKIMNADTFGIE